jgi:hypothetical protein
MQDVTPWLRNSVCPDTPIMIRFLTTILLPWINTRRVSPLRTGVPGRRNPMSPETISLGASRSSRSWVRQHGRVVGGTFRCRAFGARPGASRTPLACRESNPRGKVTWRAPPVDALDGRPRPVSTASSG